MQCFFFGTILVVLETQNFNHSYEKYVLWSAIKHIIDFIFFQERELIFLASFKLYLLAI